MILPQGWGCWPRIKGATPYKSAHANAQRWALNRVRTIHSRTCHSGPHSLPQHAGFQYMAHMA